MTYDPIYVTYGFGLFVGIFALLAMYLEDKFRNRKQAKTYRN